MKEVKRTCKVCNAELEAPKRLWCNNRCKQEAKYEQSKGLRCKYCHKPMKPVAVLGGMKQDCDRKRCIATRKPRRNSNG